ncbi:mechanosensitive ion channel protein 6-like [Silene latifolia]|uniref:mechanosensitive ion channel protein 6-like n=1 Tax=Silene latifolia TaxID=37657 RepID=UPI003D774789
MTSPGHSRYGQSHDDVIVKIDSGDDDEGTDISTHSRHLSDSNPNVESRSTQANTNSTTSTTTKNSNDDVGDSTVWRRGSSGEFSFPRPNDDGIKDTNVAETQPETNEVKLDVNLDIIEEQHQHHDNPRQSGLPPLPVDSSLSPNQSDIHSNDYGSSRKTTIIHGSDNHYGHNNNHHNHEGSKENRVSFQESYYSDKLRRRPSIYSTIEGESSSSSRDSSMTCDDDEHKDHSGEVIKRTNTNMASTRSFRGIPGISRAKSRLMDPPATPLDQRSGGITRSGPMTKSGLLGKASMVDDDEDDPFCDDDFPDEFKSGKISLLVVVEWVSLVMIGGALICSLVIPVLREKRLWNLKLWKWEVLVLVLICGRLVSDWGIRVLVFFIERNFLLRKRLLYFVYGLKKAVQTVIWLGLVLLTWHFLFDEKVEKRAQSLPIKLVTKLLLICEVGATLWLLKTLLVKFCASSFHVKAFFDRIQGSLFNQFVIETLSAPPIFELNQTQEEEDRATLAELQSMQSAGINVPQDLQSVILPRDNSGGTACKSPVGQSNRHSDHQSKKLDEGITLDRLHKLNQKNVSAWNMKRLMKIIRYGGLTTLDEHLADNATHHEDDHAVQIRSEVEAKAAARKIFRNVAKPGSRHIYLEDIMRFMKEDEAVRTMGLFEGAIETDRINKRALKSWLVNAFRERRALALTLSDTKSVVNKLHKMMNVLVSVIIIIIAIIWLNIISTESVLFLSSQVVVVAFVFGNSCKNVFESIIFLFVVHPFDVGDRCEIEGVQMVVEEINILTTVFLRYDNTKIVFPNYILLTKPIGNFYRSPDMGDAVELCFHISTPPEKIAVIRKRILTYIEHKREHWYPTPLIILKDAESLNILRIAVWLQHKMNHQDMGERYIRRALLVEECVKILREMDIEYRVYPINVNVTSIPPLNYAQSPSPIRSNAFISSDADRR